MQLACPCIARQAARSQLETTQFIPTKFSYLALDMAKCSFRQTNKRMFTLSKPAGKHEMKQVIVKLKYFYLIERKMVYFFFSAITAAFSNLKLKDQREKQIT
jgi:hypothetical protein